LATTLSSALAQWSQQTCPQTLSRQARLVACFARSRLIKGAYFNTAMSASLKVLVYLSVTFLLIFLVATDSFQVPQIERPSLAILSLAFLFAAFAAEVFPWARLLNVAGQPIARQCVFASIGLPVFGKYMPGKIWAIVGRAEFVATRLAVPLKDISILALDAQVILIWCGLTVGLATAVLLRIAPTLLVGALLAWSLVTGILFSGAVRRSARFLFRRFLRVEINLPALDPPRLLPVFSGYFLQWLLWCMGFWCLAASLTTHIVPPLVGLSFALGASLGIAAVIAPGGIGVREGVLVLSMNAAGMSLADSTAVAVASRAWFLVGETFIFLLGIVMARYCEDRTARQTVTLPH
jgi:glycosyltransferase 2 family protein